jgi:hypothetical protein
VKALISRASAINTVNQCCGQDILEIGSCPLRSVLLIQFEAAAEFTAKISGKTALLKTRHTLEAWKQRTGEKCNLTFVTLPSESVSHNWL